LLIILKKNKNNEIEKNEKKLKKNEKLIDCSARQSSSII
jgi:hypothetical protein